MEARAATRSDLAKIFRKLAPRLMGEYARAGINVAAAKDIYRQRVDEAQAHALVENGTPLGLIAWGVYPDEAHTAFAAIEPFFDPRYVLFCRRHIRTIQEAVGGMVMRSRSYSDHPDTPRWFRALGYETPEPDGAAMIYRLLPRPKVPSSPIAGPS